MNLTNIPFQTIDWSIISVERHSGETGYADWRVCSYDGLRVRIVEYSPGYKADHWCEKGHIIFCIRGDLTTELSDGRLFELRPGMSYHVEDKNFPHRSFSKGGAELFIVD